MFYHINKVNKNNQIGGKLLRGEPIWKQRNYLQWSYLGRHCKQAREFHHLRDPRLQKEI